jgi:hypothetical protein
LQKEIEVLWPDLALGQRKIFVQPEAVILIIGSVGLAAICHADETLASFFDLENDFSEEIQHCCSLYTGLIAGLMMPRWNWPAFPDSMLELTDLRVSPRWTVSRQII